MKKPELTIGISFYNAKDNIINLARCIYSQTFSDWELILADDGSTDGGADIARKIKDPRVKVIGEGKNRGMAVRYNQITKMAQGEFIARFDADDLCDPRRFEKQISFFRENPDIDVVSSDLLSLDEKDQPINRRTNPTIHQEIFRHPLKLILFHHGPLMGRTRWFNKFPYLEEYRVAVDYGLYLSSFYESYFANIAEPLYFYREYATHSFRKYYHTNLNYSNIIKNYAPPIFSSRQLLAARIARYLRIGAYAITTATGLQRKLISRRHNLVLSEQDRKQFEQAMNIIKATKIPGIDT